MSKDHHDFRALDWCVWKAFIPLLLMGLFWPIYGIILNLEHPFERAFAHGDLLLFAALLLIEAAVEGEQVRNENFRARLGRQMSKGSAIILIFIFGFLKYDVMMQEGRLAEEGARAAVFSKLAGYAYFNLLVAVAAVLYGMYSFWKSVEREHEERLSEFEHFDVSQTVR